MKTFWQRATPRHPDVAVPAKAPIQPGALNFFPLNDAANSSSPPIVARMISRLRF
jgi:hypothetical protein